MKETEKQIRKRGSGSCCVGEEQGLLGGSLGVATCDRFIYFWGGGGGVEGGCDVLGEIVLHPTPFFLVKPKLFLAGPTFSAGSNAQKF